MVGVPEGRCPQCGFEYHGWALRDPRHRSCPNCGMELDISDSDGTTQRGYSPFGANGLQTKSLDIVKYPDRTTDDSYEKNEE